MEESIDSWRVAAQLDRQYYWNYSQLLVQEGHYKDAIAALDKVRGRKADVALIKLALTTNLSGLTMRSLMPKERMRLSHRIRQKVGLSIYLSYAK